MTQTANPQGPAADGESMDKTYASIVGARLRAVRKQKQLSLLAVESASGQEFKASVLGAYERGERAISVPRLQRLARLYDVPVDQLLPDNMQDASIPAAGATEFPGRSSSRPGKVRIDLVRLRAADTSEAEALSRFFTTIQLERQDFNGQVLTIRLEDLRVIGATFGLSIDEMVTKLDALGLIFTG